MKVLNYTLAALLFSALNLQAINWPWEKKPEPVPISQTQNQNNQAEIDKNKSKEPATSISENSDKVILRLEGLESAINTKFDTKLAAVESELKSKLTEIESKLDTRNNQAINDVTNDKNALEKELNNIKSKIPNDVFKRYKVPINLTEEEKRTLEEHETFRTLVRALVALLAFVLLIFVLSHSHRKADLLNWLDQKTWGRKIIFLTNNYGVVILLVWEIVGNYNNVFEVADWILAKVGLRF